ncbi:hypothetical protein Taro_025183, partial [Colocasia esculenta]|nr:hypothetical protein [Colocasia esculenta]
MGSGEQATPSKAAPKASSTQEQAPATSTSPATAAAATAAVYPDWSGFQAYSPVPPHGFFPPVASSPQAHPYMWGAQHLMSPYGTPPPPFIMYPHGGLYAHPSMPPGSHPFSPYAIPSPNGNPEASGAASVVDGKSSEGKEKSNVKQSKGSLGNLNTITGKNNNETSKTSGASANGVFSQSDDSSSEGSSEGSDANSQNDSEPNTGGVVSYEAGASQNGGAQNGGHAPLQGTITQPVSMIPVPAAATSGGVVGPTTNLNIGMDYWGVPTPSQIAPARGKAPNASVGGLVLSGQNIPSELWLQDERELKRQRRKQSNRESARRSRLRKQAEYEELAQRAESLKDENATLRAEASRLRKEYEQLLAQNNSLKEKLGEAPKGTEDSRVDRNGQHHSGDDRQGPSDSDAQATQKDPMQSGAKDWHMQSQY